jgi:hypothetical protein
MTRRPTIAIACTEPVNVPVSAEDIIATALSVIRGQVFGKRSTEVKLIVELLRRKGFEIVRKEESVSREGMPAEGPDSVNVLPGQKRGKISAALDIK